MSWPKGVPRSPETIAKIVAAKTGKPSAKRRQPRLLGGSECWRCPTCRQWLPRSEYYARETWNGIGSQCRNCHNTGSMRTRDYEKTLETSRAYMRRARKRSPDKFREREREKARLRARDNRTAARGALNAAVRRGELRRPDRCERCGAEGRTVGGAPLKLAGDRSGAHRERIGNAVPVQAAQAIAEQMLLTMLSADLGSFALSSGGAVWVSPDREVTQ